MLREKRLLRRGNSMCNDLEGRVQGVKGNSVKQKWVGKS
jgi:hypothetical protein